MERSEDAHRNLEPESTLQIWSHLTFDEGAGQEGINEVHMIQKDRINGDSLVNYKQVSILWHKNYISA